jgi:NAD(P)H-hydrate epimerase
MDSAAIDGHGIPGYELMCRAGQACFAACRERWPHARAWAVLCGAGNNAGDGYVIARLARAAGIDVRVLPLSPPDDLRGDAARAWQDFRDAGGSIAEFTSSQCESADLLIDALLGTGLDRKVTGRYRDAIDAINDAGRPVVAVDVPSGLDADRGLPLGDAVRADLTVTFVGRKTGLYLGAGPEFTGRVVFDDLDIPAAAVGDPEPTLRLFTSAGLPAVLPARPATAHKGLFGHVLVVGGNAGMGGAVRLAGEAALRSGAGLVTVATRKENVPAVTGYRPELMCAGIENSKQLKPLLARASVVALGPGLGRDDWARSLLEALLACDQPLIVDADALNLLAETPRQREDWVLTPHPGEAARLLGCSTAEIQADRLKALRRLNSEYGGIAILKGRGSLVARHGSLPWLIDAGNPGMATAGMGDVLTGITAALVAQRPDALLDAAAAAAWLHASAGDRAALAGQRGLLAGDVIGELRACLKDAN